MTEVSSSPFSMTMRQQTAMGATAPRYLRLLQQGTAYHNLSIFRLCRQLVITTILTGINGFLVECLILN